MFARYLLLVPDNILNLLPQFLLDVGVVDEPKHHNAQGGRGRVEAGEEEENGRGDEADFEIFLREEKILVILVELFNEDINDVISLFTSGPLEYAKMKYRINNYISLYLLFSMVFLTMLTKK